MAKEITCNKCGKKNFSVYRRLGYGTKYDGDDLELDLCCDCMEKLIDECIISPIVENNHT